MIHARTVARTVASLARNAREEPIDRVLLGAVVTAYPAWLATVRLGQAIDAVAVPGQRRQALVAPVFVVGHPRSGTTLLHRLLALDPRFCAPKAWELALPAVTLHRAVEAAARADVGTTLATRVETALFGRQQAEHETRWDSPEEDDWLFVQAAASPTLEFLTRDPDASGRWWLGDELPERERRRAMRWYRRSIRRVVHAAAPGATLLSKNPHFGGWMRTLATEFPDARFVLITRDPADAIASRLSLLTRAWWRPRGGPVPREDPRLRRAFEESCALLRHVEAAFAALPDDRRWRVRYDDLVREPDAAVRAVRSHFGWPSDPEVDRRLADAASAARRRIPKAPHRLRQFGLRPADVQRELGGLDALWRSVGRRP